MAYVGIQVSVGGSYDYSTLGCTHHCPGDVGILKNLPGMEIVLPGTANEFDSLFRQSYLNQNPTYFRLSERENITSYNIQFGKAEIIQKGNLATIIAVGTALKTVLEAIIDLDVTILYYTTVFPFDADTLRESYSSHKILLCEPYYSGILAVEIYKTLQLKPIILDCIGVPYKFLTNYGHAEEHDESIGFTAKNIRERTLRLIHE